MWSFDIKVLTSFKKRLIFLAALLEAWTDFEVNRADMILSNLFGTKLDNDENEMEKSEVYNV